MVERFSSTCKILGFIALGPRKKATLGRQELCQVHWTYWLCSARLFLELNRGVHEKPPPRSENILLSQNGLESAQDSRRQHHPRAWQDVVHPRLFLRTASQTPNFSRFSDSSDSLLRWPLPGSFTKEQPGCFVPIHPDPSWVQVNMWSTHLQCAVLGRAGVLASDGSGSRRRICAASLINYLICLIHILKN